MPHTSDTRVLGYEPLLSPAGLLEELPLGSAAAGHWSSSPGPKSAPSWAAPMAGSW